MQATKNYIEALKKIEFSQASETSSRTAFENYINEFIEDAKLQKFKILQEGKRIGNFGVPDFRISFNDSMLGYIETKKTDENLDKIIKSEQIKKYRELSPNLLITNYIEFVWIKGETIHRESLCYLSDIEDRKFKLDKEKAEKVENLLLNFFSQTPEKISYPKDLALALAVRCKNLKDFINDELSRQKEQNEQERLYDLYNAFKDNIFTELTISEFSDAFAQMLSYGLFLAGLNADTKAISLDNAKRYIPSSFQLIKELINFLDELEKPEYKETKWIIDETISIINNIEWFDLKQNMSFNKKIKDNDNIETDPYIYFYENFLATYDYNLRKSKGVYYTPPQVVRFIVNAIDEILINTFKLSNGLADSNKVTVLDFATGTGTFLLEVFKIVLNNIPSQSPEKRKMIIKDHILQNLYGFEYLIAPYTIAHLKLSQFLIENGYDFQAQDRLQVYLTNTLEPVDRQIKVPFMPQLSKETQAAQAIKDKPILVITGNPPYSGHSKNNGDWIKNEIKKYNFVDGKPLGERNPKWLQDDYVKFIRFAQDKMDKVEQGIVGIITNHSFLDNPTFRGMRQSLTNTFDLMYFIDLHGNAKKKEKTPDGEKDQNVFDIEQGVCISIFIKKKGIKKGIFHSDFWGDRKTKFKLCLENSFKNIEYTELKPNSPFYLFVPQNQDNRDKYDKDWSIKDIFSLAANGIITKRDNLAIAYEKNQLIEKLYKFKNETRYSDIEISKMFSVPIQDKDKWNLRKSREYIIKRGIEENKIVNYHYRPFDIRWLYFDNVIVARLVKEIMLNFPQKDNDSFFNIALNVPRQYINKKGFKHCFVSKYVSDLNLLQSANGQVAFPLYILKNGVEKTFFGTIEKEDIVEIGFTKTENFKSEFRKFIDIKYNKHYKPEQILGYIYAVLHSETYRTKYSEFLKNDFPRIPFPVNNETFEKLSDLGFELIERHLLKKEFAFKEWQELGNYTVAGDNIVVKPEFKSIKIDNKIQKRLYINQTQYFETVPEEVYEFHIGGYQVLNKYLKDRKGRSIENELFHITNIIKVIQFTIIQMKLIENETKDWI